MEMQTKTPIPIPIPYFIVTFVTGRAKTALACGVAAGTVSGTVGVTLLKNVTAGAGPSDKHKKPRQLAGFVVSGWSYRGVA